MIYKEYAIDPSVLSSWEKVRYLLEKFSRENGRLLSVCPKKWKRNVLQNNNFRPVERSRIEEKLRNLDNISVQRVSNNFNDGMNWVTGAIAEHESNSFSIIVSDENAKSQVVVNYDTMGDDHWKVSGGVVPRTSADFCNEVSLLLKTANKVLFIDPHFEENEKRFMQPFIDFVTSAIESVYKRKEELSFELHLQLSKPSYSQDDNVRAEKRMINIKNKLADQFTNGIKIFIWRGKKGGERFHNRYIITDKSGISFGTGLDICTDGLHSETDDLHRLTRSQYEKRLEQFQEDSTCYDLMASGVVYQ